MKVIFPAPHTCPPGFALATCVVGVPLLTFVTLVDGITSVTTTLFQGFHTFMVLEAKENAVLQYSLLSVLTIKTYYDFESFGPIHFVQKTRNAGQLEVIPLLQLSFESAVVQLWIHPRNDRFILHHLVSW